MRRNSSSFCSATFALAISLLPSLAAADTAADHARQLHFSSIVLDTHADTTQFFFAKDYDFAKRNTGGSQVDIPRMKEGGLNALFLSIFIDASIMGPPAVQKALDQIDAIRTAVRDHPVDLVLATSAEDIRRAHSQNKIAILMGIEGGHMIGNDNRLIRIYSVLGVRYMTLAHFKNNEWADSSTDKPAHNGLTDFGKDVVREMNRQGILIDISHVSDKTFYDALEISKAPLIASHSSVRAISNHPRNMSNDMIKALAAKGGVIQINYELNYLSDEYRKAYEANAGDVSKADEVFKKECGDDFLCISKAQQRQLQKLQAEGKVPRVSWETIIEHIDHVAKLVGPDHVGLGSDFDGADMPDGLEDCSKLPKITEALVRKGYSDADIQNILGGNMLRVLEQSERVAAQLNTAAD
ncbi:MAG: membrane dipeptidase [Xanthomonadales bacterium]|nr:membrane dipeptidase [Xanthomonadales bacterium]